MTSLNAEQLELVKQIWEAGCGQADQLTQVGVDLFIGIFTVAPALQNEFKFAKNKTLKQLETSPRMAIHASNFMNVIRQAVGNAEDLSCMDEYLDELGHKHKRFGAKVEHFDVIRELLMEIMKNRVGSNKWTEAHEEAWGKFYDEFKIKMTKGLEQSE